MRKITFTVLLISALLFQNVSIHAFDYPKQFWTVNANYEAAINSNDYNNIILYGTQIINMIQSYPDSAEKREILVPRYDMVAKAYAQLGDYETSGRFFNELYNYVLPFGDMYRDYIKAAKARVQQYASEFDMYTDNGSYTYYGAKHEKNNGVLFGLCANGETRSLLPNESMVILYQELGQTLLGYNSNEMSRADREGLAVEFALNCPGEAYNIVNIRNYDSYLNELSALFAKYPNVPVFLRFAAEFDVWTNIPEGGAFKEAFMYVSLYFKNRNSNVALVWSPNQVSNWNVDIDDYYPGDPYVDWVGVSSYAQPYFLGDKYQSTENEITFKSGINSEAVIAIKDIVDRYGNRKPIMISESGCGHRVVRTGEDTTEFALNRLREYYGWIPMVYPQVKLIAYFDHFVNAENELNDFRLSSNKTLQNEYLRLTKGERFIQDKYSNNTSFCYRKIEDGISLGNVFKVGSYLHCYGRTVRGVTYYIDDTYIGAVSEVPFGTYLNAGSVSGNHRLKAVAVLDNGQIMETEKTVNFMGDDGNVTVEISGERIRFDQAPVIYNDRTMVPMRKIFEELGASVSWDENSQTVTGKRGDRTVKVTVDSTKMYVNNKQIILDTAPMIISDRTLVPARAVAEGMGCTVDWDSRSMLVSITPKVFTWSDWAEKLPNDVDSDLFYIESKTQYRSRERYRDEEFFTTKTKIPAMNYVREEISYGDWSDWTTDYIKSDSNTEVNVKEVSEPKRYHYAHYCTGYMEDESVRYKTSSSRFSDACSYHDLGWLDYLLDEMDGGGYVQYDSNGNKIRCPNTCYRYYIIDETGGSHTEYRSRKIYHEYVYWKWGEWSYWSDWSKWSDYEPYVDYYDGSHDVDVEERTIYRYKEK